MFKISIVKFDEIDFVRLNSFMHPKNLTIHFRRLNRILIEIKRVYFALKTSIFAHNYGQNPCTATQIYTILKLTVLWFKLLHVIWEQIEIFLACLVENTIQGVHKSWI